MVQHQPVLSQPLQDYPPVFQMCLSVWAGYQDVIQVDQDKGEACQDTVNEPLECHSGVFKTKRHSEELKQPKRGDDGGFLHISRMNWYLMIAFLQIQLGEDGGAGQAAGDVHHVGQGIAVCL